MLPTRNDDTPTRHASAPLMMPLQPILASSPSSSSSSPPPSQTVNSSAKKPETTDYSPTAFQIACGVIMVGAAAGLTLYTKKTGSMLSQMERMSKSQAERRGPKKFGPPTKEEWEKTRPRLDDDDLF